MKPSRGTLSCRHVESEILDHLAEDDPRAIASRRDLRRLNLLMAQPAITARLLRRNVARPPQRLLEIGSGDGSFMLRVARRLARDWPDVELTLLDRQHLVTDGTRDAFASLGWSVRVLTTDIFDWIGSPSSSGFDAISTNLFLHHFDDVTLSRLLSALAQRSPVFVATEPRRAQFPLLASRMLRVIGANDVTRNDAPASVRAGFRGNEISALWPDRRWMKLEERKRGLFTHTFSASSILTGEQP